MPRPEPQLPHCGVASYCVASRHATPRRVQGLGHLPTRLALRPASLDSGLHRRLQRVMEKRNIKVAKVGLG